MPIPFLGPLLTSIVGAGTELLGKRSERKAKEAEATAAWETAMGRSMENGWKDEYITVVITFPLWQIFIGNLMYVFTENDKILTANAASLKQIGELLDTPYGHLMLVVSLAAVGIKGMKALR